MIRLLSLTAKNFMSFEDLKVDLRKPGLYLISGQNDRGGDSNGSGKSSIFGAISYCLFGRTPKGVAGQDVVRWGSTASTEVELALLDGDDLLRITRGPDRLELCIGDTPAKGTRKLWNIIPGTVTYAKGDVAGFRYETSADMLPAADNEIDITMEMGWV